MTDIPDGDSLEDQLKWRRFADRVDRLVNLPDLTVGASVPFAEMIASGMAT